MPRSEWCTRPGNGFRVSMAISSASVASRLARVRSSCQPTTLREKPSRISASKPACLSFGGHSTRFTLVKIVLDPPDEIHAHWPVYGPCVCAMLMHRATAEAFAEYTIWFWRTARSPSPESVSLSRSSPLIAPNRTGTRLALPDPVSIRCYCLSASERVSLPVRPFNCADCLVFVRGRDNPVLYLGHLRVRSLDRLPKHLIQLCGWCAVRNVEVHLG